MPRIEIARRRVVQAVAAGAGLAPFGILHAQNAGPIRIGFPVPLTGPYGTEAQAQARTAALAIGEFNAAGGLNGRMAELLVRDDKLNPGEAATRTIELIEKDQAHFIVGSLSASVQLAINNVTKARGVIFNSISASDAINSPPDFSRFTFHECFTPHIVASALGRYFFPKHGKRIAFLTADYAYGHEMVAGLTRIGREFGIEVVGDLRHPVGQTDYSTLLPRLASLRPDILFSINFGRDQQIAVKQATDFGLKRNAKLITPIIPMTARLAGGAGPYEGVAGATPYYWRLEDSIPTAKAFNDRYRAAHANAVPLDYGAMAYGGVRAVLEAVKAAGSVETDKVIEAMLGLRYDYMKGPQHFRACDHQSVQPIIIVESKSRDMKDANDVFNVLHIDPPDEARLRSCEEVGRPA